MEPRGFEPLISAVHRRRHSLLELSGVCKMPANKPIPTLSFFLMFQEIHSGCCTVAAHRHRPVGAGYEAINPNGGAGSVRSEGAKGALPF